MKSQWKAEVATSVKAELGEGPLWDVRDQVLWWVNILAKELHCYNPTKSEDRCFDIRQMVSSVVVREQGGLMLALERGFAAFDPVNRDLRKLCDPEADLPHNRFNDGKCDPAGRFWAGTMHLEDVSKRSGSLYSLDANHNVTRHVSDVGISNGIVWTSDARTMYFIDTLDHRIDAFDYDLETAVVGNRRTVVEIPLTFGYPDGMAIDNENMLWVAIWGASCVARYDPTSGVEIGRVVLPVTNVSACAFGGPLLDQLYITTARYGLDSEALASQPTAGDLFVVEPHIAGVPSPMFRN